MWNSLDRPLARFLVLSLTLWWFGSESALAQSGAIEGQVVDPQGGALAGVTISVNGEADPTPRVAVTDASGGFRVAALAAGRYTVSITLDGFASQRLEVSVDIDPVTVDVTLGMALFAEQVQVVGVTPLLGSDVPIERVPAVVSVIDERTRSNRAPRRRSPIC